VTSHFRGGESDVFLKQKSGKKRDRKGDKKSCNGRTQGNKSEIKHLFLKHHIVYKRIQKPVKNHITRTRNAISKELQAEVPPERRIEEINDVTDKFACENKYFSHFNRVRKKSFF